MSTMSRYPWLENKKKLSLLEIDLINNQLINTKCCHSTEKNDIRDVGTAADLYLSSWMDWVGMGLGWDLCVG